MDEESWSSELARVLTGRRVLAFADPPDELPAHDPPALLVVGERGLPLAGAVRTPLLEVAGVLREPTSQTLQAPLAFWVRLGSGWAEEFAARLEEFELSWEPEAGGGPVQAAVRRGERSLLRGGGSVQQVADTAVELVAQLLRAPLVAVYALPRQGADGLALQAFRLAGGCDWQPPARLEADRLGPTAAGRGVVRGGEELPGVGPAGVPGECWLVAAVGRGEDCPAAALLAARPGEPWSQADRDLLAAWSEEVSLHLELTMAHEQLAVQVATYRRVLAVSLSLQRTSTLDEVLRGIAGFARETVSGQWSYVHLLSATGESFERLYGPVAAEGVLAPMPLPPRPEGICWRAVRSGSLVEARASGESAVPHRPELAALGIRHAIAVPLLADDRVVGVLVVDRSEETPLARTQRETLEVFATHAAAAVVRAELREKLAVSAASYRALFEHSSAAVVVVDWDGWIVLTNPRFEELTGYRREEVEGVMKAVVLTAPEQWRRISQNRERRLAGDRNVPETYEFDFVTGEGQRRRARMSVAVVPQTRETVITLLDITREKQLQRQLAQVEKAAAIGQLVAGVAHELNNPLAAIMGSAELALAADPPERLRDQLERVLEQSQRCRRIVANLLLFAREMQVERVPVDVNAVVLQTVELPAYELTVDNVALELRLAENLPYINGDPARLQQALLNLIVNAYHAMRSQSRGVLTITTKVVGNTVRLIVEDTGPGIKAEHLSRIFDPFFTTKPPGDGTGMGLSVSLGIIQDMAGEIWVENRVPHGARFVVSLPTARYAAAKPVAEAPAQAGVEAAGPRPKAVRGRRLLVVDDEPAVRDVLESALSAEGYVVQSLGDAGTALEALESGDFDAVICDLRLPGLDGQQFYQRALQTRPALARRFVFVTGETVSAESRRFLESVDAPALGKPFQLQELHDTVAALLRRGAEARD